MNCDLNAACREFQVSGDFVSAQPYGTGHINDTYLLKCTGGTYILQRVNTNIFRQPEQLMENFQRVTSHIARKINAAKRAGDTRRRETLHLILGRDELPYHRDPDGNFWR